MANFKDWLTVIIGLISLMGFVSATHLYWKSKIIKTFAAEKDFNHIKGNLQQFSQSLAHFDDRHDKIDLDLREIKASVLTFSQRLDAILLRLELNSGVFAHRRNKDDET